ncbi:MAG: hypothetical protein II770_05010, partial [Bacteroidales bacterium]|nr:hypothetical protein [Bacteroidales bacterium]
MPTNAEWTALKDAANFTWTWTDDYEGTGIAGRIVTSKVSGYEGNSIFLPACGGACDGFCRRAPLSRRGVGERVTWKGGHPSLEAK